MDMAAITMMMITDSTPTTPPIIAPTPLLPPKQGRDIDML